MGISSFRFGSLFCTLFLACIMRRKENTAYTSLDKRENFSFFCFFRCTDKCLRCDLILHSIQCLVFTEKEIEKSKCSLSSPHCIVVYMHAHRYFFLPPRIYWEASSSRWKQFYRVYIHFWRSFATTRHILNVNWKKFTANCPVQRTTSRLALCEGLFISVASATLCIIYGLNDIHFFSFVVFGWNDLYMRGERLSDILEMPSWATRWGWIKDLT